MCQPCSLCTAGAVFRGGTCDDVCGLLAVPTHLQTVAIDLLGKGGQMCILSTGGTSTGGHDDLHYNFACADGVTTTVSKFIKPRLYFASRDTGCTYEGSCAGITSLVELTEAWEDLAASPPTDGFCEVEIDSAAAVSNSRLCAPAALGGGGAGRGRRLQAAATSGVAYYIQMDWQIPCAAGAGKWDFEVDMDFDIGGYYEIDGEHISPNFPSDQPVRLTADLAEGQRV